jgi:hypothetical protein
LARQSPYRLLCCSFFSIKMLSICLITLMLFEAALPATLVMLYLIRRLQSKA